MLCPFCSDDKSRVIDSRIARDGRAIRRRRQCENCRERFTTYEVIESTVADVEKRGGGLQPFDREKLMRSLRLACQKRPITAAMLTEFVDLVGARVAATPRKVISSKALGDQIMAYLRERDAVAYVRYASVYRAFNTVEEFTEALAALDDIQPIDREQ